jgi:transposase
MRTLPKQNDFTLASVGIDIGKDVFHLVGFYTGGKIVLRRKIRRLALVSELEKLPPCIVGMEACLSAHFVSRTLRKLGFEPRKNGDRRAWSALF